MSDISVELIPKYFKANLTYDLSPDNWPKFPEVDWRFLRPNPYTSKTLELNLAKIEWSLLDGNPNDINMLDKNRDKSTWLYVNYETYGIYLFEQNPDKILWIHLGRNTGDLILKYKDKTTRKDKSIFFELINRSIFDYDYNSIKIDRNEINKEIIQYFYHPSRLFKTWNIYSIC
jgi:hypothetical protein